MSQPQTLLQFLFVGAAATILGHLLLRDWFRASLFSVYAAGALLHAHSAFQQSPLGHVLFPDEFFLHPILTLPISVAVGMSIRRLFPTGVLQPFRPIGRDAAHAAIAVFAGSLTYFAVRSQGPVATLCGLGTTAPWRAELSLWLFLPFLAPLLLAALHPPRPLSDHSGRLTLWYTVGVLCLTASSFGIVRGWSALPTGNEAGPIFCFK